MPHSTIPRGNTTTCVRCSRKFETGDRVIPIYIIEKIGPNPVNPREIGSWFSPEFEVAHMDCADPGINGTIIVGSK